MKSITVNLERPESAKRLTDITNKFNFEIDARSGRHVVDAKSLLGVYSLDLSGPVVLEVFSDDCADLIDALAPFIE